MFMDAASYVSVQESKPGKKRTTEDNSTGSYMCKNPMLALIQFKSSYTHTHHDYKAFRITGNFPVFPMLLTLCECWN